MYLDDLDNLLRAGASALSESLRERQQLFLQTRQKPDGGFPGRLGAADLYYTDFALRVSLLAGASPAEGGRLAKINAFLAGRAPRDVVECFSLLNASRLLARIFPAPGTGELTNLKSEMINPQSIRSVLASRRLGAGGFARPGGRETSAYHTFLAALCYEMMAEPFPDPAPAVAAVAALRRPGGGYADLASGTAGETNATAAAIAFLTMTGALTSPEPETVSFLCSMQAPDGGFRASADAPESDLLSTFTALVTLFALDGLQMVDLTAAVRLTGRLAVEGGGFRASLSDTESDLEYTYYGLGVLALARAYVEIRRGLDALAM